MKFATSRGKSAIKAVLLAFAVALVTAACGGGSSNDDELIAAITEAMNEDAPPENFDFDSECMASGMVNELGGADEIEASYGLTAEGVREGQDIDDVNLDEATARDVTDAIFDCVDMAGLITSSFAQEGLDDDAQQCLVDLIPEGSLRTMAAAGFMGDAGADLETEATDEIFNALFGGAADCGLGG